MELTDAPAAVQACMAAFTGDNGTGSMAVQLRDGLAAGLRISS